MHYDTGIVIPNDKQDKCEKDGTQGRLNTKLHAIVDGLGKPVEFTLLSC